MVVRKAVALRMIVRNTRSNHIVVMYFAAVNDDRLEESDDDTSNSTVPL